jgi:hypothetical protein
VGERQQRHVLVEGRRRVGRVAPAQLEAERAGDPVGDVPVGGEGGGLQHHHAPVRTQPRGGGDRLEQRHGGRVADVHVLAGDPDERRDPRGHAAPQVDPVGGVPRRDQPGAPLLADDLLHPGRDAAGEGAQRVAVEVHDAVRQVEEGTPAAQRAALVEGDRVSP